MEKILLAVDGSEKAEKAAENAGELAIALGSKVTILTVVDEVNIQYPSEAAKSDPNSVAGAIANEFREKGEVNLQAIGAGAVNQAVKAIAISRGFLAPRGVDLVCIPGFVDIEIDGEERTAIKFIVMSK